MARGSLSRLSERARNMPARALEVLRREGVAGLRIRALDATVYRHLLISARDLAIPARAGIELPPGIEIGFLDPAETGDYAALRPETDPAETDRRLATGHRCIVARRNGRVVHARWISPGRLESAYLGLSFELPPGIAYLHDTFTALEARRQRLSVATGALCFRVLRDEGVETALAGIWPGNAPAMALLRTNRHDLIGVIGAIRLGRRRMPVMRGMPEGYVGSVRPFTPARTAERP